MMRLKYLLFIVLSFAWGGVNANEQVTVDASSLVSSAGAKIIKVTPLVLTATENLLVGRQSAVITASGCAPGTPVTWSFSGTGMLTEQSPRMNAAGKATAKITGVALSENTVKPYQVKCSCEGKTTNFDGKIFPYRYTYTANFQSSNPGGSYIINIILWAKDLIWELPARSHLTKVTVSPIFIDDTLAINVNGIRIYSSPHFYNYENGYCQTQQGKDARSVPNYPTYSSNCFDGQNVHSVVLTGNSLAIFHQGNNAVHAMCYDYIAQMRLNFSLTAELKE